MPELTGRLRFVHLFRRAGWGASEAEIATAMAASPDEATAFGLAVANLLNYSAVQEVADRISPDPANSDTTIRWWLERMLHTRRPLLERMVYF